MFGKLLKNEMIDTGKVLLIGAGVMLFLACIAAFSGRTDPLMGSISLFLYFTGAYFVPIAGFLFVLNRYYRTMHGNEAYLTHMIPAPTHMQYDARFAAAFIALIVWVVTIFAGLLIALQGFFSITGQSVVDILGNISDTFSQVGVSGALVWAALILYGILYLMSFIAIGFFSVTVATNGSLSRFGVFGIVGVYLVTTFIYGLLNLAAMLFIPLGIRNPAALASTVTPFDSLQFVPQGMWHDFVRSLGGYEGAPEVIGLGTVLVTVLVLIFLVRYTKKQLSEHLRLQ